MGATSQDTSNSTGESREETTASGVGQQGCDKDIGDEMYGQFDDLFDAAEAKAMALVLSRMVGRRLWSDLPE